MTGSRKYNFKCQSFPNTIEQERRRRGWTVTKLAELSGVSRYSIAAYETWAAGGIVPKQQMKSVTDTTAQMIADALEVTPEQLFKHYAEAAAEHKPRVKPFSTRAERDGAILKALEPAKYTALKMCGVLQCKDVWCEMDDVIAIAYETVVEVAEEALERGIAAGVCFDAIACGAVKKLPFRPLDTGERDAPPLQGYAEFVPAGEGSGNGSEAGVFREQAAASAEGLQACGS